MTEDFRRGQRHSPQSHISGQTIRHCLSRLERNVAAVGRAVGAEAEFHSRLMQPTGVGVRSIERVVLFDRLPHHRTNDHGDAGRFDLIGHLPTIGHTAEDNLELLLLSELESFDNLLLRVGLDEDGLLAADVGEQSLVTRVGDGRVEG